MINTRTIPAAVLSLLLLSGCSGYSSMVNSLAPEKPDWEIALSSGGKIRKTEESYECEMPPAMALVGPASMPTPPSLPALVARLHFIFDSDQLVPDSVDLAENVYSNILSRNEGDVFVVGHTDTTGSQSYNDSLSLRRAEKVRDSLIELGLEAERVKISGMGERELLVETADNVYEPRNRRVEINMRSTGQDQE